MKVWYCVTLVLEGILARKDTNVNEHDRLSNFTLRNQLKVKEHDRLSNFTLRNQLKVKEQLLYCHSTLVNIYIVIYVINRLPILKLESTFRQFQRRIQRGACGTCGPPPPPKIRKAYVIQP